MSNCLFKTTFILSWNIFQNTSTYKYIYLHISTVLPQTYFYKYLLCRYLPVFMSHAETVVLQFHTFCYCYLRLKICVSEISDKCFLRLDFLRFSYDKSKQQIHICFCKLVVYPLQGWMIHFKNTINKYTELNLDLFNLQSCKIDCW